MLRESKARQHYTGDNALETSNMRRIAVRCGVALLATFVFAALWVTAGAQDPAVPKTSAADPATESPATPKSEAAPKAEAESKSEAPAKTEAPPKAETPAQTEPAPAVPKPMLEGDGKIRLSPDYPVWLDRKNKQVLVEGEVCLQQGSLEMLVTLAGGKTHESVVACKVKAFIVHAALLALGAKPGQPVQFAPTFKPAQGTEIEVRFRWTDATGKVHEIAGQDWVRHARTRRAMKDPFVFGGSGFLVDETTGERVYQAEQGDFICVSNFPTAMLDVPVPSPQDAADLVYEAFTERIPPIRTPVMVILIPKLEAKGK